MSTRMRVVGWQVQPVIMADTGDNLTSVPVQAAFIAAAEWDTFRLSGFGAALEQVRAQVEGPPAPPPAADTVPPVG